MQILHYFIYGTCAGYKIQFMIALFYYIINQFVIIYLIILLLLHISSMCVYIYLYLSPFCAAHKQYHIFKKRINLFGAWFWSLGSLSPWCQHQGLPADLSHDGRQKGKQVGGTEIGNWTTLIPFIRNPLP